MNFNSLQYFVFLPCAVILHFLLPHKWRNMQLLIFSYFFYMCWSPHYTLLLLASTVITYVFAILIDNGFLGHRKLWLILNILVNLLILAFFKYLNFLFVLINDMLAATGFGFNSPSLNILLPVGISFYIFQALGYTIDVYIKRVSAERNFIDYALFVSFFPLLVAGPIERSTTLLPQIKSKREFKRENISEGILLFLWGIFKKMTIADNLAILVNYAFDSPAGTVTGMQYALAAVLFSVQIYCDFSSYSDIARGSAIMLGFKSIRNFSAPYFALSIKDFWRRWHISLSTWFKDYLYFPLGGSRLPKPRVCLNLMIVFIVSGLWHGAALNFVFWGVLHGLYQVMSLLTKPVRIRFMVLLGIADGNKALNLLRGLLTFGMVTLAFVFFRAQSISQALHILHHIALIPVSGNAFSGLFAFPMDKEQMCAVFMAAAVLLITDYILQRSGAEYKTPTFRPIVRYAIYFLLIAATVIFGYYGSGYNPQEFIYFQF